MRLFLLLLLPFLLLGCGVPSFLVTPVANSNRLEETTVQDGKGLFPPKIAIIGVEGMLANARSGGLLQPTENPLSLFTQELDAAAKDPSVVAVVLRVNSPGGTVTASDNMYQQVKRFRETTGKPVIAAPQEVAASGGYYVSCAADKIVAQPTSVVGSIGVLFLTFDFQDTMAKIGLRSETIKSGPLKDMGSPFHHLTPEARQVMQNMVDGYFTRFVEVVAKNRPIKDEQTLKLVTDGRVFSGQQAVALGLADQTGLLTDAIDLAKTLAKAPNAKTILYRRPYGYGGSIYAANLAPQPQSNVMELNLPGSRELLPTGFYYLWQPQ